MKQDIARYIEECDVCCRVKAEHHKPAGLLQPLPIPEWKWDKIQMDFVTGLPKSQKGNDAIIVVTDQFRGVRHLLPQSTSKGAISSWLDSYCYKRTLHKDEILPTSC